MVLVMGQRVAVVVTVAAAAAATACDNQVVATTSTIVYDFMVRVHLFGRQQHNVADTVHSFRCSYIILAQMSLLQHDQFGLRRWRQ